MTHTEPNTEHMQIKQTELSTIQPVLSLLGLEVRSLTFWKPVSLHSSVQELYLGSELPVSSFGQPGAVGLWVPSA